MGSYLSRKSESTENATERLPTLRQERLHQLFWPACGGVSKIEVCEVAGDFTSKRVLFDGHPMAKELVTNSGLTSVLVFIENLEDIGVIQGFGTAEDIAWYDANFSDYTCDCDTESCGCPPRPEIIVKREDGQAVTIGDFVMQVHKFISLHRETIMAVERSTTTELERKDAELVCRSIYGWSEPPDDDSWRTGVDFFEVGIFLDWYREDSSSFRGCAVQNENDNRGVVQCIEMNMPL